MMHIALDVALLKVISPNLRKSVSSLSALCLSILDPSFQGISPPIPVQGHMAPALQRGCGQDPSSAAQAWREPPIFMAVIGTLGHVLLACFSKGIVLRVVGALWATFPVPVEIWERPFSSWQSQTPRRDSAHGWTRASLQGGGLSASPAAAATCCHVLIGSAENLAPHLRHALISL